MCHIFSTVGSNNLSLNADMVPFLFRGTAKGNWAVIQSSHAQRACQFAGGPEIAQYCAGLLHI